MTNKSEIDVFRNLLSKCLVLPEVSMVKPSIKEFLRCKSTTIVSFLNFHAVNISMKNNDFKMALLDSDYLYRDGVGTEVAMKAISKAPGINMNGTDLIPQIIQSGTEENLPIILWGTEAQYLIKAKNYIEKSDGKVLDICDGFQDYEHYVERLVKLDIDKGIIILAMGMPKQELLSKKLKSRFPAGFTVVNGGAVLDFIAGKQPRAPAFMRKLKLEFLYRLTREPRRMWRRTILGGTAFIYKTLVLYIKK